MMHRDDITHLIKSWFFFHENKLKVEADVAVQISYYNECLAAWEPLLEPVMIDNEKSLWEVQLKVKGFYQ